eukprot:4484732-Alexandrium_andersonii.AAC.1
MTEKDAAGACNPALWAEIRQHRRGLASSRGAGCRGWPVFQQGPPRVENGPGEGCREGAAEREKAAARPNPCS